MSHSLEAPGDSSDGFRTNESAVFRDQPQPLPVPEAESELAEPRLRVGGLLLLVLADGGSSDVEMPTAEVTSSMTGAVLKKKPKLRDSR